MISSGALKVRYIANKANFSDIQSFGKNITDKAKKELMIRVSKLGIPNPLSLGKMITDQLTGVCKNPVSTQEQ